MSKPCSNRLIINNHAFDYIIIMEWHCKFSLYSLVLGTNEQNSNIDISDDSISIRIT